MQGCSPEPPLHLYDIQEIEMEMPFIDLNLDVYWNYETDLGIDYNWRNEWYYGWDDTDRELFGELGYVMPKVFNLRRYYTANTPYAPHTGVIANSVEGNKYLGRYNWGYWDFLVWNQVSTLDGVQSLNFDEQTSLDSVIAYTNQTMHVSRYQAPRFTHSFYAPEPLYSAYEQAIDVNRDLEGFIYDSSRDIWIKTLNMMLHPITYIYLTQVILHHNEGRVTAIDGSSSLSGMARAINVNTGKSSNDAITVHYNTRMKRNIPLVPYGARSEEATDTIERVDIIGGRLMTFGICNLLANDITRTDEVKESNRHYMDLTMQFNNGMDSTFVFDVTQQVRNHYRGGVITVELNLDTIPIPQRSGGSGFNAVVRDTEDGGTFIIDM